LAIWEHIPEADLPELYRSCDVFVSLPYGEGFGLPFQEAMACHPAGTLVESKGAWVPIETVCGSDSVTTHVARTQIVRDKSSRPYKGNLVELSVAGMNGRKLTPTPEHPYLTNRGWVPAGSLTLTDKLLLPCPEPTQQLARVLYNGIDLSSDNIARIIGWYLAEGSIRTKARVEFTLGSKEERSAGNLIADLHAVGCNDVKVERRGSAIRIIPVNRNLCSLLRETCGRGSERKHLPAFWDQMGPAQLKHLIVAYFKGDGSFSTTSRQIYSTSVSPSLGFGMHRALLCIGYLSSVNYYIRDGHHPYYIVRLAGEPARDLAASCDRRIRPLTANTGSERLGVEFVELDGVRYASRAIRAINTSKFNGTVYNFSVDTDESYVVDCATVHNCGKPVIYPKSSSMLDFCTDEAGYGVEVEEEPVMGMQSPWYDAKQMWWRPQYKSTRDAFMKAYTDWKSGRLKAKGKAARKRIEELHSFEKVGMAMKERIEAIQASL
jgi:hypothetical protein